jgi:YjbE family integral membrane protein
MDFLALGSSIGGILLLDLLLSGDNMLVIGSTAAGLARRERWYAIVIGGIAAMLLRILFTALASEILNISFIQTIGALILLYLAQRLLRERTHIGIDHPKQQLKPQTSLELEHDHHQEHTRPDHHNVFLTALLTILVADVTMSLDNILAVGALANGEMLPLIIGLIGSITVLLVGSALISVLVERLSWLIDVAALVLGWTSATMIHDDLIHIATTRHITFLLTLDQIKFPLNLSELQLLLAILTCGFVLCCDLIYRRRATLKNRENAYHLR